MEKVSRHTGASAPAAKSLQRDTSEIRVFPAELLLGPFDMVFDPALAWLDCAQRHGEMFLSSRWNPQRHASS